MLRIKLSQNLHDIVWGLGIVKDYKILETEPLRNILLYSQNLSNNWTNVNKEKDIELIPHIIWDYLRLRLIFDYNKNDRKPT